MPPPATPPPLLRRLLHLGAAGLALALLGAPAPAPAAAPSEYEVKAAFLFNFANFVTWPPSAFSSPDAPIVIGIVGPNPFEGRLSRLLEGEKIAGRPLVRRLVSSDDELLACHILFIAASEEKRIPTLLAHLRSRPILTISETDRFCEAGGMIHLSTLNRKVGFDINPQALRGAGLQPNARLLNVARKIHGPSPAAP